MVKSPVRFILIVVLAFITYSVTAVLHLHFWAELIAPICGFLAAALIFHAIFSSKNTAFRINFILAGVAVLCWALADTLRFIFSYILDINPHTNFFVTALYFCTNGFLLVSTLLYAYNRLHKWDTVQLVLDGTVYSFSILWLIWSLLYQKSLDKVSALLDFSVLNTLSIGTDAFLIVVIGIWYLSIRRGSVPLFLRLLIGGVFLYALVDLVYFHLYTNDLYLPDSFLDITYLAALVWIAISIKLYYIRYPAAYASNTTNANIGSQHKGFILLFFPLLILLLGTITASDIVVYSLAILFHEGATSYIHKSITDKQRLNQEMDTNKKLETLVSEKAEDLKTLNAALLERNDDLKYALEHDSLTKLYNRNYFLEKLDDAIHSATGKHRVSLLLWNVDNLKGINDTYSHTIGDQVLITVANRMRELFHGSDVLARIGGDEFGYFLEGTHQLDAIMAIAKQIVDTCSLPFQIDEYSFSITVGVGISIYPECATDRSTLLRNADIAMHYAKETKKDTHIATYSDIGNAMNRKHQIASFLKTVDYNQDLHLHFQPQFRLHDRALIGMEALLRWECPGIGPVSPAEFIPIAEEENLIIPIGNWVIENAVGQIAAWNRRYHTNLRMGINFSPKQFDQASTFDVLDEVTKRHHAKFEWIDIEITENVALDNEVSAGIIKKYFKNKKMTVSIDDFGTGYSSLGYLTIQLFNRLKIAKPLIDEITTDEPSRKIVKSIILLAKSLDLETIAEGVEEKQQFDILRQLGCDQVQGYYAGHPVAAIEFETTHLKHLPTDVDSPSEP